ncbi:MAG TPA: PA domain-containing protein [Polyangia bacterium]|nr:PA domain-containing protein [Polyangia bacterium]
MTRRARPLSGAAISALAAAAMLWPAVAHATATFVIQNMDAPGEGLNDPTPAAPVGGNSGTTVGQQRLNAFKEAARIWGTMIDSAVPIVIASNFSALSCSSTGITLGQARTSGLEIDQPGGPQDLYLVEALADRLAGFDLNPGVEDIDATFNGALSTCSGGTEDWYYGFDGKPPGDDLDLIKVLLHEFGHGLGFVAEIDVTTGALAGVIYPDVFVTHLYDNQANMLWSDMTDDQRFASMQNVRHLVWHGDNVDKLAPTVLAKGAPRIAVTPSPSGFSGALAEATFGPLLSAGRVQGPIALGDASYLCNSGFPSSYAGQIVLFQGGVCTYSALANFAQVYGGAIGIIFSDAVGEAPPSSLEDPRTQAAMFPVNIPVVGVSDDDAALLAQGDSVSLDADSTRLVGADAQGHVYMYASNPILPLSTVSHWDPLARPNLIEEPTDSYIISHDLRMEAALMKDIGWAPFCGNGTLDPGEDCDDGANNSDIVPGACKTNCTRSHCGDGKVDTGEQCDNGANNSDTAPGACRTTCVNASCGDGVVDPGEACDDGPNNSDATPAACRTTCVKASCGDGVLDPGEQCDDGSANATGAACDTACHLPGSQTGTGGGGGGGGTTGGTGPGQSGGGGCSCAVEGSRPGAPLVLLVGLGLLGIRRRSRSR